MSEPSDPQTYCSVGEIRLFPYKGKNIPKGWMECDGRELEIIQYSTLYSVIGELYGGDGRYKFRIPDLRGRAAVGAGAMDSRQRPVEGPAGLPVIGSSGGAEQVTLTLSQMPAHRHTVIADTTNRTTGSTPNTLRNSIPSTARKPQNAAATAPAAPSIYGPAKSGSLQALAAQSVKPAGNSAAHENRQPFLPLVYCIAVGGFYPTPRGF
ncbi:phage tail protein [Ancylobacter sp. IITR112]|uniref:phage tail protein n=1 Tax=Ancylobacter sp. IITR112 TaxID=3138073 RepID=UPI00352AEFC7